MMHHASCATRFASRSLVAALSETGTYAYARPPYFRPRGHDVPCLFAPNSPRIDGLVSIRNYLVTIYSYSAYNAHATGVGGPG